MSWYMAPIGFSRGIWRDEIGIPLLCKNLSNVTYISNWKSVWCQERHLKSDNTVEIKSELISSL